MKITTLSAALLAAMLCAAIADRAAGDTFGSGPNSFEIDFVTIGDAPNDADTTGLPNPAGSVPYVYRIGKYEISEDMIDKANALGGLGITYYDFPGVDKPATGITWYEAAQFVNWLNTSTGGTPAYKFDGSGNFQLWTPSDAGYNPNNLYRNSLARYVLPSVDEWYKAAYYDPNADVYYDYPTGSDTPPLSVASGTASGTAVYDRPPFSDPAEIMLAGGLSPYGTMGQGGNVSEWQETDFDLVNDSTGPGRGDRGGGWAYDSSILLSSFWFSVPPASEYGDLGFRVVTIPEPILPGDYNGNGVVDAADYTVWRDGLGSTYVDADFDVWKAHFGETLGSGAFAGVAIPEPSTIVLLGLGVAGVLGLRWRHGTR